MKRFPLVCAVVMLVGVSACSESSQSPLASFTEPDPKEANEETFRALVAKVRPDESCLEVNYLGGQVPEVTAPHFSLYYLAMMPSYQVLIDRGYLEKRDNPHREREIILVATPTKEAMARKLSSGNPIARDKNYHVGFCPGKVVVDSVTYTEPADYMGQKISRVTAKWHLADIPPDFPAMNSDASIDQHYVRPAALSGESKHEFTLTNTGWE